MNPDRNASTKKYQRPATAAQMHPEQMNQDLITPCNPDTDFPMFLVGNGLHQVGPDHYAFQGHLLGPLNSSVVFSISQFYAIPLFMTAFQNFEQTKTWEIVNFEPQTVKNLSVTRFLPNYDMCLPVHRTNHLSV